jgi:hypothetical protein
MRRLPSSGDEARVKVLSCDTPGRSGEIETLIAEQPQ